ncbi:MAG TPA: AAA family ATPase [Solirubrobacterales bacterium]|nr:AAA family ATPase [Solirubrobacterales bacterium]
MDELFERLGELGELDAQIERAAVGQGCLAVVEGPAGIGKSRLLAEARCRAEGSMRVLSSRGSELEGEFPFGVVRQLFDSELADPGRRDALIGGAADATAGIFGELPAPSDGAEGASFASLHGLLGLVLALTDEGPLLLSVDDLHWCDRPSLMFLTFLARRIEGRPILLLTGLREAEPGSDPGLLGELVHDPAATRIRPGPLGEATVTALVEDRLGSPAEREFVAACLESTGGNPLLLTQLVIALAGEGVLPDARHVGHVNQIGPRAISRTVLVRLARLPDEAQSVARAVAVLGDGAGLPAVAGLARVDEGQVAEATRELARAEILRPDPPLGFVHPLVRAAVYQDLSIGERELEHARAATLLREVGAPVDRIAAQLLHTAPRGEPWAAELLWEAGRGAMHTGAADSAVAYLRRALDQLSAEAETTVDSERARLSFELGVAEALTNGAAAQEHLALAREGLSDPFERGAAAALLARTVLFRGAPEEAASIAADAAAELPPELEDLRMEFEALESMAVFFGADRGDRHERLREHRGHIRQNLGSRMLASVAAWETLCSGGTAAESAELALGALEGGRLWAADPYLIPFAAIVSLIVADRPELVEIWKDVLEAAHRHGSLVSASSTHLWLGYSHLCRGELTAAAESLREADEAFTLWGHDAYANASSRSVMVDVLRESGRLTEAERMLDQIGEVRPNTHNYSLSLTGRIGVLMATNRATEAVAVADELAALGEAVPDASRLWWRSLKAEALDRLDRREEALELVREELVVTSAFGAPSWLGRTLRVLGTLEEDDGLANLREAVTVLEGSTARLEHAKALAALGFGLRRARKPTEARDPLRRALELAAACGAEPLAEQVRSELRASGARPRREALGGIESLTASERRVADLAASGRTNREIAQELYVTLKTVEVHLSNTYRKLDIRSRRELPRALGESASSL